MIPFGGAGSLRLRLLLAAGVSIVAALLIAGLALSYIFERHVSRRLDAELASHLRQLAANVALGNDGALAVASLADPRFDRPLSGLYWQVEDEASVLQRSRSLWDQALALPRDEPASAELHRHLVPGARPGETAVVAERILILPTNGGEKRLRLAVAADEAEIARATTEFRSDLALSLALLAIALMLASWAQTGVGLRPLGFIRERVEEVRRGRIERLPTGAPPEVAPLIAEINGLLDASDRALERARAHAADLAHGLKTPLTVLANDVERLKQRGQDDIAADLAEVGDLMRRHVEHQLVRARARGRSARAISEIAPVVERVLRAMRRTPKGAALDWTTDLEPGLAARIDADDLTEILGNLLENAAKWAKSRVRIATLTAERFARIIVEDDGPGIPSDNMNRVLERGVRADESVAGTGLGLAIVRELVEACGGILILAATEPTGLRVEISLPADTLATSSP